MSQEFDKKKIDIFKQKGFYPYQYMTDFENFKEPSKETFYSSLNNRKVNSKEYEHVLNIWNKFGMKTMKDYHDLYLKCDVLLLADVFEKFRNKSHYLSASVFSWDLMLKMAKIELERITYRFWYVHIIWKMYKRWRFYISNRYSKANNKYFKSYYPKQESNQ